MPLGREDVIWAYRMLLGREPENEEVVLARMGFDNRDTLRSQFMASEEFLANAQEKERTIGRFQHIREIRAEVTCSPEQISIMIDHIAAEWRRYGREAPHWSVLTGDNFKPDNIDQNIEDFYATGLAHAEIMLNPLSRAGVDITYFDRVMDFGCAVGRLTLALAPIAGAIVGVDISPPHLALARARAGESSNAMFVSIDTVTDIGRLGSFDLIVSFIVLQHNPPPVMAEILKGLLSCLARGGCIIVQIPTFIDDYSFNVDRYIDDLKPGIDANLLPQHFIFKIFADQECDILEVREDNYLGGSSLSHTFAARRR